MVLALFLLSPVYAQPTKGTLLLLPDVSYEAYKMSSGKYMYKFPSGMRATDGNMYAFMLSAIKENYKDAGSYMGPQLELYPIGSMNAISLNAQKYRYFILPRKNESGQVESIIFWRE